MTDWDETEALGEPTEGLGEPCERCGSGEADASDGLCTDCADYNEGRVTA